jgi:hypothetical protein
MHTLLLSTCCGVAALLAGGVASANEELNKMSQDPRDWVMQTGNYANHRYSRLKQITTRQRQSSCKSRDSRPSTRCKSPGRPWRCSIPGSHVSRNAPYA